MAKDILVAVLLFTLIISNRAYSTEFDELDKPPEGAHKGQMLLGGFVCIGVPMGDLIDAEDDFLEDSVYTFDNEVTKAIEVSHQSFAFGISFEYMPLDHIGSITRLRKTYIVQRSNFGSAYQNWRGYIYRDTSFYLGPTIHATNRKIWDFVLVPLIGFYSSKYYAAPVAAKTITGFPGDRRKTSKGLSFGVELNCSIYFSRGLYITLGGEWIRNSMDIGSAFNLANPQTSIDYYDGTSSNLDTYNFIITAGYAFSN